MQQQSDTPYPRPPLTMIVTGQEWTSLSITTIFSPRGYATLRVFTGAQALQRMSETSIDLLIVDQRLKDMTGTQLVTRLRKQGYNVPLVIFSTSEWPRAEKLAALAAGAWDVCSLPMDAEELFLRADCWARYKLERDQVLEQGLLDPETGLYNVQGLLRRVAEMGAGATRHHRPLACVVVAALSGPDRTASAPFTAAETLATVLRSVGRASDAIGRMSHTEFVVMAPDTDPEGALILAERLRKAAETTSVKRSMPFSVRFGCFAVPDMSAASLAPSELLIRATEALRAQPEPGDPIRYFEDPTRTN